MARADDFQFSSEPERKTQAPRQQQQSNQRQQRPTGGALPAGRFPWFLFIGYTILCGMFSAFNHLVLTRFKMHSWNGDSMRS